MQKKIGICSDHAGYELKEQVKKHLEALGYSVSDFGTHSTESSDYPDYAHPMGRAIEEGELPKGISICGSGNGISIVLNKYPHVRAALSWSKEIARLAREHNDANVLALPARFVGEGEAMEIVDTFLDTAFEGGRHQRRIDKIPIQ